MKKSLLQIVRLSTCIVVLFASSGAVANGLIINDGVTLTIDGPTLDVNCRDILIKNGGTLHLKSGTLKDPGTVTREPGGVFTNDSGIAVIHCNKIPVVTVGQNFSVAEDSLNGNVVGTVVATDEDGTSFSDWSISSGNVDGIFAIDPDSGEITVIDNTNLDHETTSSYTLSITVSDGLDTSTAEDVTINVTDANEAPVLDPIGDWTVSEFSTLSFTAAATDPDLPGDTLSYSLSGEPAGATIGSVSGVFSWTPSEPQGPGVYTFTVSVSDTRNPTPLTDSETIQVTVNEANEAPTLDPVGDKTVDEMTELAFTATASDSDIPANTLSYSLSGEPAGAVIDSVTGEFSWTPTEDQGPGSYPLTVEVSDGALNDSETIQVTVNEVNVAPVLTDPGNQINGVGDVVNLFVIARDDDIPANTLTWSATGLPPTLTINPLTGEISGTIDATASVIVPYNIQVSLSDNGSPLMSAAPVSFQWVIIDSNSAPVLAFIGDKGLVEGTTLSFTATATDSETLPANLRYSLLSAIPEPSIDPVSGLFTWTPSEAQGPGSYSLTVVVTDDGAPPLIDFETITVTVSEENSAPVLASIGNKNGNELSAISFTATATDSDLPANTLSFSLSGTVPTGAAIDSVAGLFSWTPTEAQGPASYTFNVVVTDNGPGALSASETITVTVNEVNSAPDLAVIGNKVVNELSPLSFTATATDVDLPVNTRTFSLTGTVPDGAAITPATGQFNWTPTEAQGPRIYPITVQVTDGALTDFETIQVTVNEVNASPVLTPIGSFTHNELSQLSFTATASDSDDPVNSLSFSLAGTVPVGASIDSANGQFTWTPTEAQGGLTTPYSFDVVVTDNGTPPQSDSETIQVAVNEVNAQPVLVNPGDQINGDTDVVSLFIAATDEDIPANTLLWSAANLPDGLVIDANSGEIAGTVSSSAVTGSPFSVTINLEDNGSPPAAAAQIAFTWTVTDANRSPILDPIGSQAGDELTMLTFTAIGQDPDTPPDNLVFSLESAPTGAVIDNDSGVFSWTPTEDQGPGTYEFVVVLTDDGSPSLTASEAITISVGEVNTPPVLVPITDQLVGERMELTFRVTPADPDLPANSLTLSLDGVPAGASFDSTTGDFLWVPLLSDVGIYPMTQHVHDGFIDASQSFVVEVIDVNYPPVFTGTPTIIGTIDDGLPLDLIDTGTADDDGDTVTLSYQWFADGVAIDSAVSPTFTIISSIRGTTITCTLTADDGNGGTASYTTDGVFIKKFPWWSFWPAVMKAAQDNRGL